MKLDRNILGRDGLGKYALLKLRQMEAFAPQSAFGSSEITKAVEVLDAAGLIEWGLPNTEGEFFVIKLRDRCAYRALHAYADDAQFGLGDAEWSGAVRALANRAGKKSPFCKDPD